MHVEQDGHAAAEPLRRLARPAGARGPRRYYRRGRAARSQHQRHRPPARGAPRRVRAPARGGRRAPRRGGHAAGDLLRVQPRGLRPERAVAAGVRGPADDRGRRPTGSASVAETRVAWVDEEDLVTLGLLRVPRGARRRASPRTTPGCCRCSRRPSRSCSRPGLVKVVFATETLSLGINMPAEDGGDRGPVEVLRASGTSC